MCLEERVDPVGWFKEGGNKWLMDSDSEPEESKSPTTPGIKPDETGLKEILHNVRFFNFGDP